MSAVMDWKQLPKQEPAKFAKPKGDERKRLIKARTALILGQGVFWGLLALRLELVEAPWIITAGVDGKRMFYNPWYICPLSDEELRGLWAHEVTHCSNGHIWRRSGRDKQKWNWAADYAIDPLLVEAELKVPNATINPNWKGKSGEQIYLLMPEPPKQPSGGMGMPGIPGEPGDQDGQGNGQGQSQGQGGASDPRTPQWMPGKDVMLEPEEADAKQQSVEWKEATIQAAKIAKGQGKLPSNLEMLIEEWVAPKVDWKSVLRMLVQTTASADFSWRRPSPRHIGRGMYLPKVESEQVPPIKFGWDTSGSHWAKEIQDAVAAEVLEIIQEVRPEKIDIAFFDAIIQATQTFEQGDIFRPKPKGGGGTDFRPVFDWIEKSGDDPACLIMLTDCMGSFPDKAPPYPVFWASTIRPDRLGTYTPPFGEIVFIDLEGE